MKLCSFRADGRATYGLVTDTGIIDLGKRLEAPTLRDFLATQNMAAATALASEPADYDFDSVEHDPVIPNPDKIICVGLNYHDHVKENWSGGDDKSCPLHTLPR